MKSLRCPFSHSSTLAATSSERFLGRKTHSQMTPTRQPAASSAVRLFRSRRTLAANFRSQELLLVAGVVVRRQPSWRCQKQPCTKQTAPKRGKTRSGRPGSAESWSLYRSPRAWSARRRINSGPVFRLWTLAMIRERVALSKVSGTLSPALGPAADSLWEASRLLHRLRLRPHRRGGVEPTAASCTAASSPPVYPRAVSANRTG